MSIRTPALAGGGELCPLHPFPVATVAASRQPPPFSPSPFPSTIKSRPCQSSRRSHESLSAACSSPEPSPRLLAPATFRPGLAPAASQTGQRGLGQGRAREAEYACSWSPGAVLPRRNFASPPPSVAPRPVACVGALPGPELVAAPDSLCGPSRAGGTGWTSPGCAPGGLNPSGYPRGDVALQASPLIAEPLWDVPREGWIPPG